MRLSSIKGFTLIEVVVSLFLLAVMSVMSYQAVEAVLGVNQRSQANLAEEMNLQLAWQVISNDMIHLRQRPYPDGLGGVEGAYVTGFTDILLSFSRGGGPSLESNPSGLTRVRYRLNEEGELLRSSWPVYLSLRDFEEQERILLRGVNEVSFDQIARDNYAAPVWPPIDMSAEQALSSLPRMVQVTIELNDGSRTRRLFPGVDSEL